MRQQRTCATFCDTLVPVLSRLLAFSLSDDRGPSSWVKMVLLKPVLPSITVRTRPSVSWVFHALDSLEMRTSCGYFVAFRSGYLLRCEASSQYKNSKNGVLELDVEGISSLFTKVIPPLRQPSYHIGCYIASLYEHKTPERYDL
ncbi:hypothetical protein F4782DRAFT_315586 [Xylaria castorea]|nr:hypothetical protein F4782DRAFT_315586 [Xylaria castorea]